MTAIDHDLFSFALSFLIGFLIGIEREQSHQEGTQPIGVRTFILFSLLGTLAAKINFLSLIIAISFFVFSIIIVSYYRSTLLRAKKIDIGITTEIAAVIVYCLGYLTFYENILSIILSALILLVLLERKRLHKLAHKKFSAPEIETAILLVIFALGIIPVLPNHAIDPFNLFNPRIFAILIATIAALQFAGYIAIRLFGEKTGLVLLGFLGGFVSSTVVFVNLSHTLKAHSKNKSVVIASAILANLAMLIEMMIIVFVAAQDFLFYIFKPMLAMCTMSIVIVFLILLFNKERNTKQTLSEKPVNFQTIIRSALLIFSALIIVALTKHFAGPDATLLVSFLTGLFEIHGVSLATGLLYENHQLSLHIAALALFSAIIGAFISKLFLVWSTTERKFALITSGYLLLILTSGAVGYWIFI